LRGLPQKAERKRQLQSNHNYNF